MDDNLARIEAKLDALTSFIYLREPPYNEHWPNTSSARLAWALYTMALALQTTGEIGAERPFPGDILPQREKHGYNNPEVQKPRHIIDLGGDSE